MEGYLLILFGVIKVGSMAWGIFRPNDHRTAWLLWIEISGRVRNIGVLVGVIGVLCVAAVLPPSNVVGWVVTVMGGLYLTSGTFMICAPKQYTKLNEVLKTASLRYWRIRCMAKTAWGMVFVIWGVSSQIG